jgi:Astacin (Peptidase family M12A)
MNNWLKAVSAALVIMSVAFPASNRSFASESEILKALESGAIKEGSQLALPGNEAPSFVADDNSNLLLNITKEQQKYISDRAFLLMAAKWPFNIMFVCWEDADPQQFALRTLVKDAVTETWDDNSALKIVGWGTCQPNTSGVRIKVEDSGPHVKFLGKDLDGVPSGMVLNFTFKNWSQSCQDTIDYCVRTIAVHEFGHAIGFAHEQNRPDTPGECATLAQGTDGDTLLSPWDPNSVMNYCNEKYNNDGNLSEFDIKGVQFVYGAP